MTTTIGSSQATLTDNAFGNSTPHSYYYTRFVSAPLDQASISANTWSYNFAASEDGTGQAVRNNFPVDGTNKVVYVNCYVWRPSTQTKIGTVLDGDTAATVDEASANTEAAHHVTFSGSAVSSMSNGDVIILEIWFRITETAGGSTGNTNNFFYDGTTENTTEGATVSNHASFLETPETLTFSSGTTFTRTPSDTITLSESVQAIKNPGEGINMTNEATKTYANKFITKV